MENTNLRITSKKRKILTAAAAAAAILIFAVIMTVLFFNSTPEAADDEILVNIVLDLDDDIGLLLINYDVNGSDGAGGISNADRSMLRKDSSDLYWSFSKDHLDAPDDTVDVVLVFTAVTKYFDPNYDNIYPEEYTVPIGYVAFSADFGKIYRVTVTGNADDGYSVFME